MKCVERTRVESLWTEKQENNEVVFSERMFVNSVGEDVIWVANPNGSIENGDYIQSSH